MSLNAVILIRTKNIAEENRALKRLYEYAQQQEIHITGIIRLSEQDRLIRSDGSCRIMKMLKEHQADILMVPAFRHLSIDKNQIKEMLKILQNQNMQCYAVLEQMYLQELKPFLDHAF